MFSVKEKQIKDCIKQNSEDVEIICLSKVDFDGVNEELVSEESKDFASQIICAICQNIVLNPTSCKHCQNLFCIKCIEEWLRKSYNNKCPMRCARFESQEVPKATRNVINKIKFKCVKSEIGCKELINYENYEKHLKTCDFIKYKCMHCDFYGNYEICAEHSNNCSASFIECKYCEKKLKKKIFNIMHNEKNCHAESGKKPLLIFLNLVLNLKKISGEISATVKENESIKQIINNYEKENENMLITKLKNLNLEENIPEDHLVKLNPIDDEEKLQFKYLDNVSYLVLSQNGYPSKLNITNLQAQQIKLNLDLNALNIDYWKYLKNYSIIIFSYSKSLHFYSLIKNKVIAIKSFDKIYPVKIYHNSKSDTLFMLDRMTKKLSVYSIKIMEDSINISFIEELDFEIISLKCYIKSIDKFFVYGRYGVSDNLFLKNASSISKLFLYNFTTKTKEEVVLNENGIQNSEFSCISISNPTILIIKDIKTLTVVNYSTLKTEQIIPNAHDHEINHMIKTKIKGKPMIITSDEGGVIKIWKAYDMSNIFSFDSASLILSIDYGVSNGFLFVLDNNFTVKCWDIVYRLKQKQLI